MNHIAAHNHREMRKLKWDIIQHGEEEIYFEPGKAPVKRAITGRNQPAGEIPSVGPNTVYHKGFHRFVIGDYKQRGADSNIRNERGIPVSINYVRKVVGFE